MVLPELNQPNTKTQKSRQHQQKPQQTVMVMKPNNPHFKKKAQLGIVTECRAPTKVKDWQAQRTGNTGK